MSGGFAAQTEGALEGFLAEPELDTAISEQPACTQPATLDLTRPDSPEAAVEYPAVIPGGVSQRTGSPPSSAQKRTPETPAPLL